MLKKKAKIDVKDVVVELPLHLRTDKFIEVWEDFRRLRAEMRKPLSPTNEKWLLKKLEKYDEPTARAMVIQSLENRWQGIFELKRQAYSQRNAVTYEDIERVTRELLSETARRAEA